MRHPNQGTGRIEKSVESSQQSPNLMRALRDVRAGKPIIVVDSLDRENEGDIVLAAEKATIETLTFTIREARGLMCLPTDGAILDRLDIPMMVAHNSDKLCTPFTVSIDAADGVTTGVSAGDRLRTIQILLSADSSPSDLSRPGHLFPLRPRAGGLRERQGHTEASVTVMKMAGLMPVAVIAEIMNDDGTMSRMPDLESFADKHRLTIVTIDEIIEALGDAVQCLAQTKALIETDISTGV